MRGWQDEQCGGVNRVYLFVCLFIYEYIYLLIDLFTFLFITSSFIKLVFFCNLFVGHMFSTFIMGSVFVPNKY